MPAVTTPALPFLSVATPPASAPVSTARFTLDGDAGLETLLGALCELVRTGVERVVFGERLEGILLGGGYGRGEGGVLSTPEGDRPYNDLEFYVLLRGATPLNDWLFRPKLNELAHALSGRAGIEVEFKIISVADLARGPVTMFSYDLVRGNRRVAGPASLLADCAHHERAEAIPLVEATRLLMNRCSGLLFAQQRLNRHPFTADDADFVERNLAKLKLALGDAVLVAHGRYHWSCRERSGRLAALPVAGEPAWLEAVRAEHAAGVDFKLRPRRSERTAAALAEDLRRLSQLACRVWLWLESRRLRTDFRSPINYALHPAAKCPGRGIVRNWLVTALRVGPREALGPRALRYPRERLFRVLPVLLWQPVMAVNPRVLRYLQRQLHTAARNETGLVAAYTRLWESFR